MSLLRTALYSPLGNHVARSLLRPIAGLLPDQALFPIVGRVAVRMPDGKTLWLEANPTSYGTKQLFWRGHTGFEPDVLPVFRHLIQGAGTFLDIGSNIGYYALVAGLYNPEVQVHAFEPLPGPARHIRLNAAANGLEEITVAEMALSDTVGRATFYAARNPKFKWVEDHLTSTGSLDPAQAARSPLVDDVDVRVMTLDAYCSESGIEHVDLMKLDTEATEHLVLDGAKQTIAHSRPPILCEVLPGRVEDEIQKRVAALDYRAFTIHSEGLRPAGDLLAHERGSTNDHLFCPAEGLDRVAALMADS